VIGRAACILGGNPRFKEAKRRIFDKMMEFASAPKLYA
jgi:hypothetical protein